MAAIPGLGPGRLRPRQALAGAVLLAWAIVDKGLWRGGEEALHVNPARDRFLMRSSSLLPRSDLNVNRKRSWRRTAAGMMAVRQRR